MSTCEEPSCTQSGSGQLERQQLYCTQAGKRGRMDGGADKADVRRLLARAAGKWADVENK